jgi:putative flippase GtrA
MTGLIQGGIDRGCERSSALGWNAHRRKLCFLLVGACCFTLQYAVLRALSGAGLARPIANGIGFVISAQVNFLLSSAFTWADRGSDGARSEGISKPRLRSNPSRWLSYNGTAAVALVVNTVVFALADRIVGALPAALAGVAAGTVVTFLVCDRLIFATGAPEATEITGATEVTEAVRVIRVSPITEAVESLWESVS